MVELDSGLVVPEREKLYTPDPAKLYVAGEGQRVTRFGEKFIVQTKGRWAGKFIEHENWQRQLLRELFLRRPDGTRVYDRALIGISRKNGKSTLGAELALYSLMATGEQSPEVYAAAASKDQARIVFNQAREFVDASPNLKDYLKPMRAVIECKGNRGVFRALASDAPLQYGLNPNAVIIDELWAHANPELYYALTTADIARENPLVLSITTAGFDRESLCYSLYEEGLALRREGGIEAMRKAGFLFWWYEVPAEIDGEEIDYRDESFWHMANPSSWITLDRLRAYQQRFPEPVFRRLHLNQWTESEDSWIKPWQWDALRGKPTVLSNEPVWMGIDIGTRHDSAALVWVQWHGNELHVGYQILNPTGEEDFGVADARERAMLVAAQLQDLKEINFDPFHFLESSEIMAERGVPMVEFPQNALRMEPASDNLFQLIKDRRIVHDGNREFRAHVLNAVAAPTERGGWRISKRKSLAKIDACIALAMAADRAVTMRNAPRKGTIRLG